MRLGREELNRIFREQPRNDHSFWQGEDFIRCQGCPKDAEVLPLIGSCLGAWRALGRQLLE